MLHLFHPGFVHFSVAFVVAGAAAEIWGTLGGREPVRRWGATMLIAGLISLVPTLASGYLAANTVEVPDEAAGLLESHERNAWLLLGLLFGSQFWKAWCGGSIPQRQRKLYVLALLAIALLALYGAWLGGRMVYEHAVGIAAR